MAHLDGIFFFFWVSGICYYQILISTILIIETLSKNKYINNEKHYNEPTVGIKEVLRNGQKDPIPKS